MAGHISRARIIAAAGGFSLALALLEGCGPYRTYNGAPKGFSTHPYRITYPRTFVANELPQMSAEMMVLSLMTENKPVAPNAPEAPAMIVVRCYRMREQETTQTFMERYYDDLEPRFLDLQMRPVGPNPRASEWSVTAGAGLFTARVIVLPREKLAYDVATMCRPDRLKQFETAFRRARDSFRLLPARP